MPREWEKQFQRLWAGFWDYHIPVCGLQLLERNWGSAGLLLPASQGRRSSLHIFCLAWWGCLCCKVRKCYLFPLSSHLAKQGSKLLSDLRILGYSRERRSCLMPHAWEHIAGDDLAYRFLQINGWYLRILPDNKTGGNSDPVKEWLPNAVPTCSQNRVTKRQEGQNPMGLFLPIPKNTTPCLRVPMCHDALLSQTRCIIAKPRVPAFPCSHWGVPEPKPNKFHCWWVSDFRPLF